MASNGNSRHGQTRFMVAPDGRVPLMRRRGRRSGKKKRGSVFPPLLCDRPRHRAARHGEIVDPEHRPGRLARQRGVDDVGRRGGRAGGDPVRRRQAPAPGAWSSRRFEAVRIRGRLAPSLAVIPHREPETDDAALIAAARQGDGAAFTRLFRRHADAVRTRITRLVGPVAERDDLVQKVFIALPPRVAHLSRRREALDLPSSHRRQRRVRSPARPPPLGRQRGPARRRGAGRAC